jgi:hypothetical protein
MTEECPRCGSDQRGENEGSRTIGIEVRGAYDGVLFWQCPDCDGRWHRFPEGHYLRLCAESFVTA